MGRLSCSTGSWRICNRGKTPGTPVQHALALGTRGAEFRHFLASDCGTTWDDTKSARGFAPLTGMLSSLLYFIGIFVASTWIIYEQLREAIRISDLLTRISHTHYDGCIV